MTPLPSDFLYKVYYILYDRFLTSITNIYTWEYGQLNDLQSYYADNSSPYNELVSIGTTYGPHYF